MKKILTQALSLALILSLLCAGAAFAAADYTGVWYANIYGQEMALTLNDGGVYTVNFTDESEGSDGVWEVTDDGVLLDKGTADETALIYDALTENLTGDLDGLQLVFAREFVPMEFAAARTDAAPEEYDGGWAATRFILGDIQTTPEDAEVELFMHVEGGLNCLSMIIKDVNTTINIVPEYVDGAMILTMNAEDGSASYTVVCHLLEDGAMLAEFPVEFFGQEASFLLAKL